MTQTTQVTQASEVRIPPAGDPFRAAAERADDHYARAAELDAQGRRGEATHLAALAGSWATAAERHRPA